MFEKRIKYCLYLVQVRKKEFSTLYSIWYLESDTRVQDTSAFLQVRYLTPTTLL